ncbi:hypothetical protein LAZ67_23000975 [Cordylochernes scorpioides]|uniref:Copia protein n=1 Tax=Cordylochernes scorpioides TaxID=51811 RepID=A0ABY6LUA4_9ARAC|nr:hypothetical protein LAZ67_23000975 [Cordylochernes scorpioides]
MHSNRSRHINRKYHYIKDDFNDKIITLKYISSEDNPADIMTKNLSGTEQGAKWEIQTRRGKRNLCRKHQNIPKSLLLSYLHSIRVTPRHLAQSETKMTSR